MGWIFACHIEDIDPEDLMRLDHGGQTYAIYRDPKGGFHATDGLCSHEKVHLCDGLVMGDQIECPKHNGRFNYVSGEATRAPCVQRLRTHPVRVVGDTVEIELA